MGRGALAAMASVPCTLLLLPAYIIALAMTGFVRAVRGLGRLVERRFVAWSDLIAFDPVLGWKPKPNLNTYYLAERDDVFSVVTDAEGWPGRRSLDASPVVVLGDSFAFGYGVDADRTFADVDPQFPAKPVGAPGYSMVHGVRLIEHFGARLSGKLVVWLVYLENDLQDNLTPEMRQYRTPFVRRSVDAQWEIVDSHLEPARWRASSFDATRLFPRFCVPGPLADRAYAAADYLIGRAERASSEVGAKLVVVTVPHPMQLCATGHARLASLSGNAEGCDPSLPDRRLEESCARRGIPMLAGRDYLTPADYKRREGIHWNERGHRRMAGVLRGIYDSHRSGELRASVSGDELRAAAGVLRMRRA